ncbi:ATP-binding protein [Pseudonocardia spinosispora]|uniref:ATP-binding protein n=1 Tax=Pseudonocardia spinosispora TaxID=103441 RepID=UPI0004012892|nr:ATP-binding protein [Pseudonocardia spinosispora]
MTATQVGLRHEAVPHHTTAELLAELTPRVRDALSRAEQVETVLEPEAEAGLRRRLGDSARHVTFRDPTEVYGCYSAQSIAVARRREFAELGSLGPRTVFEQVDCIVDGAERPAAFWAELVRATDIALADLPVTVLRTSSHRAERPSARRHRRTLAAPAPPMPTPPDLTLEFGLAELRDVRAEATRFAHWCQLDSDLTESFVLALGEVTTNSVEHGAGRGTVRLWAGMGELAVEIHDSGVLADPHLGLCPPDPRGARGRGLWMARQLSTVMQVWISGSGTFIRQNFDRASARRSNQAVHLR